MNRDLEALEDRVYVLHKKRYPYEKEIRSGFSALQSELRTLISQYPKPQPFQCRAASTAYKGE